MNPRLLTVAFPSLTPEDRTFIDTVRSEHDPASARIAPHFTLVFGTAALDQPSYAEHVGRIAATTAPIRFVCRYAMLAADDEDESAYTFLVPDEGLGAIARLHDALYGGPLKPSLRLDLPYVPHVTLARSLDREAMRSLCAELNARPLCVTGTIDALHVGTTASGRFETIARIPLATGDR